MRFRRRKLRAGRQQQISSLMAWTLSMTCTIEGFCSSLPSAVSRQKIIRTIQVSRKITLAIMKMALVAKTKKCEMGSWSMKKTTATVIIIIFR